MVLGLPLRRAEPFRVPRRLDHGEEEVQRTVTPEVLDHHPQFARFGDDVAGGHRQRPVAVQPPGGFDADLNVASEAAVRVDRDAVGEPAIGVTGPGYVDRIEDTGLTDAVDEDLDERSVADLHFDALDACQRLLGAASGRHVGRAAVAAPEYDQRYGLGGHGGIRVLPRADQIL